MDEIIVFSVFEISQHLKQVVETQIEPMYVRGEISNYTRHGSGHIYFSLKDPNATLRCTFFRFANLTLNFEPEEGMEVICFGKLSIYEKGGTYNLNVQSMSLSGQGDLAQKFELLKNKLQAEGLFEQEHKKKLPRYPQRIGVITSATGAALQDIINVLTRRFPIELDVYPAVVQGSDAPPQLIAGLQFFNSAKNVDVIIIGRGGGSQEDLFCFNDEALAREIFRSQIPIVSAVGHEIDFTIADFVADLRAPTPSAAAELVTPDRKDLLAYLSSLAETLGMKLSGQVDRDKRQVSDLQYKLSRFHPEKVWQNLQMRLDMAAMDLLKSSSRFQSSLHRYELRQTIALNSMHNNVRESIQRRKHYLNELQIRLENLGDTCFTEYTNRYEKLKLRFEGLSPLAILNQGYSMLQRGDQVLSSVKQLKENEELQIRMQDGSADVQVLRFTPAEKKIETE